MDFTLLGRCSVCGAEMWLDKLTNQIFTDQESEDHTCTLPDDRCEHCAQCGELMSEHDDGECPKKFLEL